MKDIKKGLLAFLTVPATIDGLWFTNKLVIPKRVTWEDLLAEDLERLECTRPCLWIL
jgi:hypothetical protein